MGVQIVPVLSDEKISFLCRLIECPYLSEVVLAVQARQHLNTLQE